MKSVYLKIYACVSHVLDEPWHMRALNKLMRIDWKELKTLLYKLYKNKHFVHFQAMERIVPKSQRVWLKTTNLVKNNWIVHAKDSDNLCFTSAFIAMEGIYSKKHCIWQHTRHLFENNLFWNLTKQTAVFHFWNVWAWHSGLSYVLNKTVLVISSGALLNV